MFQKISNKIITKNIKILILHQKNKNPNWDLSYQD
jgi:hypothetical protein